MGELITDPLLRNALLHTVILAAVCGPLGVWVLHTRQAFAAESLSHAMLPGLVLGAIAGIPLLIGAIGGIVVAGACVAVAARDRRIGPDTAVAIVVSTLLGLGIILALNPDVPPRLTELLFGDPLAVTPTELAVAAGLATLVLSGLAGLARPLRVVTFDRVAAPSLGARPALASTALLVLLAVSIALAARGLGSLLVVALILAPAAAALRASERLGTQLRFGALFGAVSAVAGLEASRSLDLAAGPAVAAAACGLYLVAAIARPGQRRAVAGRAPIDMLTR